jgi:uncharacterized protein YbjT (DUF2867 family)
VGHVTGLILVTGGTGTLGRFVVQRLTDGAQLRVLSRQAEPAGQDQAGWAAGDLKTGRGIEAAVSGADVIVHCATTLGKDDVAAAGRLIDAARRVGHPHLVYISIVGVDRVPVGYYKAKLEVERLVEGSGLPWSVLRATQFHQLILRGCELLARLPVLLVPAATSFQPIDAAEVAARLAELATGPPAGRVPDMGGPEIRGAGDLGRCYLKARGRRRRVLPVRLPGAAFAGYRNGYHLAPEHAVGQATFAQFLAERFGPGRGVSAGST